MNNVVHKQKRKDQAAGRALLEALRAALDFLTSSCQSLPSKYTASKITFNSLIILPHPPDLSNFLKLTFEALEF